SDNRKISNFILHALYLLPYSRNGMKIKTNLILSPKITSWIFILIETGRFYNQTARSEQLLFLDF
ncbi:MAG: hypothetical protein ACPLRX_10285, partial [Candidatus Saccharicenans sp.]